MVKYHPSPQQEKKGLSPWVWLGIGCVGILVVSAMAFSVAGYFIYGKAKDVAREIEEDPVAVTARFIAAANPEIELVDADKSNQIITFRNTETGEDFTFDYDDIEEGRFSFTSGDDSASIEFNTDGEDSGGMTITTGDGQTMTYGAGASEQPSWVPVYPGTEPQGAFASETPDMRVGAFSFENERRPRAGPGFLRFRAGSGGLRDPKPDDDAQGRYPRGNDFRRGTLGDCYCLGER